MDPQTIVVWVSGCVLSAVIIYLISVCTMREKTYDEVMAEQRKQHEALLGKTKPDKKEKKKKAKKSKSDVKISSSEETVASEDATDGLSDDGVSKMVELELEPEVIEPGKHDTPKQSRKNKKSILHNKEEKSLVRKSMTVEEQFHPSNMPKDDVEMKYERERRLSEKSDTGVAAAPPVAPTKKEKKKKNKEPKPEPVEIQVEEVMQMQAAPTLQGKAPGQKKDKKNKYSEGDGTPESSEVSRLFTSVSSTKLSEKEIQGLIDVLLSKSDKPGAAEKQWTKKSQKGDPLALISKQLEDKDQQLGEEKTKILAAGIRLKDLNKDLVQEKQRVTLLEKSLQEVDGRHKEEIKALHLRMQNTHTEHQNETQRLITQIQQQQATSGQNQAAMIQRLTEENNKLKEAAAAAQAMAHSQVDVGNLQQKLKIMETEMSSNILKLNTEQNNNQVLQNKLKKMEKERNDADQRKKETDSVLNRKMSEYENMSRELKQAKDSYNQVNQELASTRNQYQNVEQSRNQETEVIRDVKDKLNNAETANKQLEAKLSQVTKTRTEQDQQIQTLQASLQSLQSEKVSLQNTMLEMKTSATNGVAETSVKAEEVKQLSSAKDDLSKTVDSLKKELESKSTASDELSRTIESLQKDLDAQKKRNNDLSQSISDLQSSQDKYKSTEDAYKTLEDKYSQSSKQVTSLQEQLGAQSSELGNVQNQMGTVQNQLETVQSQFDHLTKEYNALQDQQKANTKYDETSEKLNQEEHKNRALNIEKLELSEKTRVLEEYIKNVESEMENRLKRITDLEQEIKIKDSLMITLQEELAAIKSHNIELKDQQNQNQQAASSDAAQIEAQLQEKKALTGKLEAEMATLRKENTELNVQKSQLEVNNLTLQDDLKLINMNLETKGNEFDALVMQEQVLITASELDKEDIANLKKEIDKKDEEIRMLKESEKTLEECVKETEVLRTEFQQLSTRSGSESGESNQLKEQIADLEKEKLVLADEKESINVRFTELKQQFDSSQPTIAALEDKVKYMESQMGSAPSTEELVTLKEQFENSEALKSELETKLQELKSKLDAAPTVNDMENLKVQLENTMREKSELEANLDNMNAGLVSEMGVLREQFEKAEKERVDLQTQLQEANSKLQIAPQASEFDNLKEQFESVLTEKTELQKILEETNSKLDSSPLVAEMDVLRSQFENVQKEKAELQSKLEETSSKLDASPLVGELDVLKSQFENVQRENSELQNKLADLNSKYESSPLVAEMDVLKEQLESLQKEKSDLKIKLEETNAKLDLSPLVAEMDVLRSQFEDAQNQLQEKDQKLQLLEASQDALDGQDVQALQSEIEELRRQVNEERVISEQSKQQIQELDKSPLLAEMETLKSHLEETQSELSEAKTRIGQLELEKAALVNQERAVNGHDGDDTVTQLQETLVALKNENSELRLGCEQATHALTKAEKSAEEVTSQYQRDAKDKMAKIESLQVELETKNTQISELMSKITSTNTTEHTNSHSHFTGQDINVYTRVEEHSSIDFSQIISDLDEKRAELAILQQVLVQKEKQIESLKAQGADSNTNNSTSKEVDELKEQLKGKDGELEAMQNSVKFYWIQNEELNKKVESLEARKQQLESQQNGGGQLVDASRGSEIRDLESKVESYKTQCEQLQESAKRTSSDDDKLKVAREKWEGQIENALKEAFPNIKVKDTTRHEDFISIFRKELVQVVHSKSEEGSSEAVNSPQSIESSDTAEVSRLQAQVSHYQQVLADTERILNQLQNSVESEEQTWKQRIVNLEEENARLKKPSPSQPKDMEDKVRELEERLSSSESEKLSLQSRLSESSVSLHSIKAELDLLRNSPATREDLLQELEDSRKREKELKKEKAKLSGMVKLGQDEFKREQDLVKSLQQKMQSHSLANGTSPESEAASAQSKDGTSV